MNPDQEDPVSETELVKWLKKTLLRDDVGEKVCGSLLKHLSDLNLLISDEKGSWKISFPFKEKSTEGDDWCNKVMGLCLEPEGFALKYFLKDLPPGVSLFWSDPIGYQGKIPDEMLEGEDKSRPKKSSNLSNLQIVKKVGRQLSPLIEMENYFLEQLQGPSTSRQDARILFNYLISRIKVKGEPREWTQLSRRRHK